MPLTHNSFLMDPNPKTARLAGFLYFIVVLTGIFTLAYVPGKLIEWDDAALTYTRIRDSEMLFRFSILAGVICYTTFLFLPLALYKLFNNVSTPHAIAMVMLAVVSVPLSLYNLVHKVHVLTLIENEPLHQTIAAESSPYLAMQSLQYYDHGIGIISIFWGLWLLPLGYLVYRCAFLPKILGILLMIGCMGYLINFTGGLLIRNYANLGIARIISLPASFGEIGLCLWLLVVGIKK